MEQVREVAEACVGRAVMFGTLAIACVMVGFSFNPVSAFRSGAVLTLVMAAVLIWKAVAANRQDPKQTEVWLYLDQHSRPAGEHARHAFGKVMREVYGRFAQFSLYAACAMFAVSLVLGMFGLEPYQPPRPPELL